MIFLSSFIAALLDLDTLGLTARGRRTTCSSRPEMFMHYSCRLHLHHPFSEPLPVSAFKSQTQLQHVFLSGSYAFRKERCVIVSYIHNLWIFVTQIQLWLGPSFFPACSLRLAICCTRSLSLYTFNRDTIFAVGEHFVCLCLFQWFQRFCPRQWVVPWVWPESLMVLPWRQGFLCSISLQACMESPGQRLHIWVKLVETWIVYCTKLGSV